MGQVPDHQLSAAAPPAERREDAGALSRPVLALLVLSVWLNYLDRGNLSVAAPVLGPALGIDERRMGVLLSAFFWTYVACQPIAGLLVDRLNVYRLYAAALALWSVAIVAMGFSGGFASLLAFRLLLGAGESAAYPSYARLLAQGVPEHRRGWANALVDAATKAGPALGTLIGGLMIAPFGWRPFFVVVGAASLLWLAPWLAATAHAPLGRATARASVPVRALLRERAVWTTFAGLFFINYAYFFLATWLPSYLVRERHFSMTAMAYVGALPFAATTVASLVAGRVSDARIRAGRDPGRTRRRIVVAGLLVAAAGLPAAALARDEAVALSVLTVAFAGIGVFTSNLWAITQTMAGPRAAGAWTGLQNAFGNVGGALAPLVTGFIVARTGSFVAAFVLAGVALLGAAACYGLVLGPIAPLAFPERATIGGHDAD
jgi:MFS family permease